MEWIKQMSLKKSLSVIIIAFAAVGLVLYFVAMLITSNIAPTPIWVEPFGFLKLIPPFVIAISMPFFAGAIFYKIKLKAPISQLSMGAKRIMENDLNFSVEACSKDELGQLCKSFESMRIELIKSNRELWKQMEERKRLNAAFAHDLRNPVTVLKGSAAMLQKGFDSGSLTVETAGESIALITQYSSRIESYIQAMTSVQKLEELAFAPKEIGWHALTTELKNSLIILGTDAKKEIEFLCSNKDSKIYVDRYMVNNVAENLVSNALQYSKGSITVEMSCDDERIIVCVSDCGDGFSPAVLKKGAMPFLRDDNAGQGQNFGMGLYICRLLCEKHSGTLTLENTPIGAKATATFYFDELRDF